MTIRWLSHEHSLTAAHREGVDGVHKVGVGCYVPLVVADGDEALKQVRRKESMNKWNPPIT